VSTCEAIVWRGEDEPELWCTQPVGHDGAHGDGLQEIRWENPGVGVSIVLLEDGSAIRYDAINPAGVALTGPEWRRRHLAGGQ
jgi:hypothetical protein